MRWREVEGSSGGPPYWQYIGGLAVYGTVQHAEDGKAIWIARVNGECCLPNLAGPSPEGKALTIEGAKKVVELLCEVTGSVPNQFCDSKKVPSLISSALSWEIFDMLKEKGADIGNASVPMIAGIIDRTLSVADATYSKKFSDFIEPIPLKAGDRRVLVGGEPFRADFRIISEGNYQRLLEHFPLKTGKQ